MIVAGLQTWIGTVTCTSSYAVQMHDARGALGSAGDWLMNDNPKPQINFKKMLLRCTGVIPDYWSRHSVG